MTNSEIVDTLEEVKAVVDGLLYVDMFSMAEFSCSTAATMLLRLHKRAVDAEAHAFRSLQIAREQAIEAHNAENNVEKLQALLATARVDALRPDVAAVLAGEAVVVPRVATEAMVNAAYGAHDRFEREATPSEGKVWCGLSSAYRAMIATSPYAAKETRDAE